jgi:hypothetical protein
MSTVIFLKVHPIHFHLGPWSLQITSIYSKYLVPFSIKSPEITKTNQKEIINILKTVMEQNYLQFYQQYYKQTEGLAMGAPTLAILAEVYIQYMEHKQLYPI